MDSWQRLDGFEPDRARAALERCCGSPSWVDGMMSRRPFGSRDTLLRTAREVWFGLAPADWLDAFSAHPRIGDVEGLRHRVCADSRPVGARAGGRVDGGRRRPGGARRGQSQLRGPLRIHVHHLRHRQDGRRDAGAAPTPSRQRSRDRASRSRPGSRRRSPRSGWTRWRSDAGAATGGQNRREGPAAELVDRQSRFARFVFGDRARAQSAQEVVQQPLSRRRIVEDVTDECRLRRPLDERAKAGRRLVTGRRERRRRRPHSGSAIAPDADPSPGRSR